MRFSNSNVQLPPLDCNGYVIGQRTESDRTADGNRLGGERLQGGALVSSAPTKQSSTQQSCQVPNKAVKCTNILSVVNILAWLVHLRQVHPLKNAEE